MELCGFSPGYNQGMVKKPTRLYFVSSFWCEGGITLPGGGGGGCRAKAKRTCGVQTDPVRL